MGGRLETDLFKKVAKKMEEVALLPLVVMGTAPHIIPGYDMLRPMNRFSHSHLYSHNCGCPIEEHSRTIDVIGLRGACRRTEW